VRDRVYKLNPVYDNEHILDCFECVFGGFAESLRTVDSDGPEDVRFLILYVMLDDLGAPRGASYD
jgi:hypothetical protein